VLNESEWVYLFQNKNFNPLHETELGLEKVIQQHGSLPECALQEGETFAIEKIQPKENLNFRTQ